MVKNPKNPFSFKKLDENIARLEKKFGKPKHSRLISIKGKNRIFVFIGDQEYLVPCWHSMKGNLCWKINGILYVKRINGSISKKEQGKRWTTADFVTTKAKALESEPEPKVDLERLRQDMEDTTTTFIG